MSIGLTYTDTVQIVKPVIDEYGTEQIGEIETVNCLFITKTGMSHSNNQDVITADAELYIDPENDFVKDNYYRLEEMLIIFDKIIFWVNI